MIVPNFVFTFQFFISLGIICTEGKKNNNNNNIKYNLHYAKRNFYRSVNAIFDRIGRILEVILQIKSKCLPMLICVLEVGSVSNSDLRALGFIVDRFFMKLFQTSKMEIIRQVVNFVLPSEVIEKCTNKFLPVSSLL